VPDRSTFRYQDANDSPGFLLWKLTGRWQARVAEALGPFGLTQTQYAVLASLRWFETHDQQPTQRHLVEHTTIDKMTLSKAIRRLEAAGLVARQPPPRRPEPPRSASHCVADVPLSRQSSRSREPTRRSLPHSTAAGYRPGWPFAAT
jgi:MarR family